MNQNSSSPKVLFITGCILGLAGMIFLGAMARGLPAGVPHVLATAGAFVLGVIGMTCSNELTRGKRPSFLFFPVQTSSSNSFLEELKQNKLLLRLGTLMLPIASVSFIIFKQNYEMSIYDACKIGVVLLLFMWVGIWSERTLIGFQRSTQKVSGIFCFWP